MAKRVIPEQAYASRVYSWQLSQIPSDHTTHDELIYAFQQYYKANLHWMQAGTKQSAQDARFWLNEISHLTLKRRKFILEWKKKISDKTNTDRNFKSTTRKQRKLERIQALAKKDTDN